MQTHSFSTLRSVFILIGSIVGAGVFGVPYALAQSGLSLGLLLLLVMGTLMTVLLLMNGEVILQTPGRHRIVGYSKIYLKGHWWILAFFGLVATAWGAMLAYLLVGGDFLSSLFSLGGWQVSPFWCAWILAICAGYAIFRGLRFASKAEVVVIGLILFLFLFVVLASAPFVKAPHLFTIHWSQAFFPYGVLLFALSGSGAIPEIKDVLGKRAKSLMGFVILGGMGTIILLYALFSFAIIGVTGSLTTPVAFDGLIPLLGGAFHFLVSLIGSLITLSIFMMIGVELKHLFRYDFSISNGWAWALTLFPPLLLYLAGFREFVVIIGFVGAVFGGILGIMSVWIYERMRQRLQKGHHYCFHVPRGVSLILILVFLAGMITEIVNLVR